MKLGWPLSGSRHGVARAFAAFTLLAVSLSEPIAARSQEIPSDAGWRDLSLEQYRQQLQNLDSIVAAPAPDRCFWQAAVWGWRSADKFPRLRSGAGWPRQPRARAPEVSLPRNSLSRASLTIA
jgi:hypothetical protein